MLFLATLVMGRTRAAQRAYEHDLETFDYKPMLPPQPIRRRRNLGKIMTDEDEERQRPMEVEEEQQLGEAPQYRVEVKQKPIDDNGRPCKKKRKKRNKRTATAQSHIEEPEEEIR